MRLTAEIEGINLEKLLRAASEAGIVLRHARRTGARRMRVCVDWPKRRALKALCDQRGWQMRETGASSLVRAGRFFKSRPMLIAGLFLCVASVYVSSHLILAVRVENAREYSAEVRRFLHESGVRPGALKARFSIDDLRGKLAYRLPGLSFAGMRYAGSTLIVDCRTAIEGEQLAVGGEGQDIVAAQAGIITRISVSSGTPLVAEGQAVRKGQVLIRGEERTEKGAARSVKAQGQVKARVFSSGQAVVSLRETRTVETGRQRTRVTVRTPWHSRVVRDAEPFASQDVSRERQTVVGLYLPLWRDKETYAETEVFLSERNFSDAASMAQGAAEEIAKKQCPYDALILDKWVDYSMIDNEFLYATVVLEYETGVAGRIQ